MVLEGIKHSWQGYYYVIPGSQSTVGYGKGSETFSTVIRGDTPEEVESEVNKYLRAIKDNPTTRPSYYKRAGRKRGGNRRVQTQRDLAKLFGNVDAAIKGGVVIANAKALEWAANQLLNRTISEAEYNNFTGNLESAYKVTIISGRKKAKEIWWDKAKKGFIKFGPKGGRFVELQKPPKHKFKGREFNGTEGRYMKKWEKSRGYQNDQHSITANIDRNWSGGRYGEWKAQGAIFIENTAPYAGSVQIGHGYRVLSPAQRNRIAKKHETLVQLYIGKTLRQAGLIR